MKQLFLLTLLSLSLASFSQEASRPNVLFISIDDMRGDHPDSKYMVAPNLSKLAQEGRYFSSHYAVCPTCGSSRAAMLRSRYPSKALFGNHATSIMDQKEHRSISLPEHFKKNSYHTVCIGKISHRDTGFSNYKKKTPELKHAWSEIATELSIFSGANGKYKKGDTGERFLHSYADGKVQSKNKKNTSAYRPLIEKVDRPNEVYADNIVTDTAIKKLAELSEKDQPFFLAVGLMRPHLPWSAPKWAFDKNNPQNIPIPPKERPKNLPSGLIRQSGEMTGMYNWDIADKNWAEEVREKAHAYWSSLTFSDYQVGRIIAQLDALKLRDNTIIVIWGDHGWNLGEQGLWGKHNIIETSLHSQLIVLAPKMAEAGQASHSVTDSTDLFPSLCELAGIESPTGLDGKSFAKNIMENPLEKHRNYAASHWQQGTSIRRGDWRCIRWKKGDFSLQNIKNDPYWSQDSAKENPTVIEEFKKVFNEFDQQLKNK